MNNRRATFDLFLISALGLFLELIFIRWAASELRLLAFYKNFALIAAFLGLGLGFALRRRKEQAPLFERYFFPFLTFCVVLILVLGRTSLSEFILLNRDTTQEFIWAGQSLLQNPLVNLLLDIAFFFVILLLFLLITLLFIPLGEITARKFADFRPLPAYTINVLGSLSGILFYTLISFLSWPPVLWFLISAAAGMYFLLPVKGEKNQQPSGEAGWRTTLDSLLVQAVAASLPVILTLVWPTGAERTVWSPYYRIDIQPRFAENDPNVQLGYELLVNQAWHQRLWNLAPDFVQANYATSPDHFDETVVEYDIPYQLAPRLENVLIVGAGAGNDAAGALRAGTQHVTAVDIDPAILQIGKQLHPEHPYDDPRVKLVTTDARSFFRRDQEKYDLIVFARLDSHTLFSTASSVRLDNFVYSIESFRDVERLLKPDGVVALLFGVPGPQEWVRQRLYRTLTDAFGHAPQAYLMPSDMILFVISPQPFDQPQVNHPKIKYLPDFPYRADLDPVTDNWPYLYLQARAVPSTYLIGLCGVLLISLFLIRRLIPDFQRLNLHFFFMGAAFFLLETKSITEMALLFGSTWIVNAAVIAAILCMIVLANLLVEYFGWRDARPFYALLFLALAFNYLVPVSRYLSLDLTLRIALACITQALPLFFAGTIFAISFSQTESIEDALGSNLIGSVLGGVFEYASLVFGIRSLYLLALVFYIISALALSRWERGRVRFAD